MPETLKKERERDNTLTTNLPLAPLQTQHLHLKRRIALCYPPGGPAPRVCDFRSPNILISKVRAELPAPDFKESGLWASQSDMYTERTSHFLDPTEARSLAPSLLLFMTCFPCVAQLVNNLPAMGETWFDPWVGKIPGEGKGYPFQYSGPENSMDCIVHGVAKSLIRLSFFHFTSFLTLSHSFVHSFLPHSLNKHLFLPRPHSALEEAKPQRSRSFCPLSSQELLLF